MTVDVVFPKKKKKEVDGECPTPSEENFPMDGYSNDENLWEYLCQIGILRNPPPQKSTLFTKTLAKEAGDRYSGMNTGITHLNSVAQRLKQSGNQKEKEEAKKQGEEQHKESITKSSSTNSTNTTSTKTIKGEQTDPEPTDSDKDKDKDKDKNSIKNIKHTSNIQNHSESTKT